MAATRPLEESGGTASGRVDPSRSFIRSASFRVSSQ